MIENTEEHFTDVAKNYNRLRDFDQEVVEIISDTISEVEGTVSLDVACGTARYPIAIARKYGHKFICADRNGEMLAEIDREFSNRGDMIEFIQTNGVENIPVPENGYGVITNMNALHHFGDISEFVSSVRDVMADKGKFLIYTRIGQQNDRTIWGQHFPDFSAKENRFLGQSGFPFRELGKQFLEGGMIIEMVQRIEAKRKDTLSDLVEKIRHKHYSTFSMYESAELVKATEEFVEKIKEEFPETATNPEFQILHSSLMSMIFLKKML